MNELVLDISVWDEGIDLAAWKSKRGIWGVIIKAGGHEGGGRYKDRLFEAHYKQAKALGLHVGAYYYTTSTTKSDARADAEHFAGLLSGKSLDMPAYMDVEDARQYALGRRALTDVIIAFCDSIAASGLMAGIYVNGSTLTSLVYADELAKYAVWVAAWKQGWPSYALDAGLWQQGTMRLSDGYVFFDDVSGCVDASWCRVDYPSKSGGSEQESGPITATVYIHGGDMDCSELVRVCYRAVDVLPYGSYMWTGNELELLGEHGFNERSLSSPQIGDVLWRSGHTELYLGNGLQGGARHGDYAGGLDGRQGDQDGTEVTRSAYRASDWTKLLRYEGGKTVDGIPAAVAAALVCDHVIDHDAHGYSQPHRSGDGTIETVTITWNGKSEEKSDDEPSGSDEWEVFPVSKTITVRSDSLNVRDAPSTTSGKVVACYSKGDKIIIDGVAINGGYAWGSYIGATSGKRRYVALGSTELAQ